MLLRFFVPKSIHSSSFCCNDTYLQEINKTPFLVSSRFVTGKRLSCCSEAGSKWLSAFPWKNCYTYIPLDVFGNFKNSCFSDLRKGEADTEICKFLIRNGRPGNQAPNDLFQLFAFFCSSVFCFLVSGLSTIVDFSVVIMQ